MNKKKLAMGLALALLMLPATAFATTVEAVADKTSVQAGDTVEVVITVQGEDMSIAEGSFTYDPAVLTFTEGEGGASDGFLNLVSVEQGVPIPLRPGSYSLRPGKGPPTWRQRSRRYWIMTGKNRKAPKPAYPLG